MKMETQIKEIIEVEQIKYCSDYDNTCQELVNPNKCFIGGTWVCQNGYTSEMPMADGVCKELEIRSK